MSLDLVVENPIANSWQAVKDQQGNASALFIGTQEAMVKGKDIGGGSYPFIIEECTDPTSTNYIGRMLRLQTKDRATFYNFGIDKSGNLFISSGVNESVQLLSISPTGVINLTLKGLTPPPSGTPTTDLVVDANGKLYKQN